MKNIHILPTDKPSQLYNYNDTPNILFLDLLREREPVSVVQHHNIYITSDEEIKKGYWAIANGGIRFVTSINNDKSKTFTDDGIISKQSPSSYCHLKHYKKIILTTDQDLIKDGVQAIDDEFLEWFVKNPSCEFVEVIPIGFEDREDYLIIIPKEEVKPFKDMQQLTEVAWEKFKKKPFPSKKKESKQETLEEVKDLAYYKTNAEEDYLQVPISVLRYISQLEQEQEQDKNKYSEEDMVVFGNKMQLVSDVDFDGNVKFAFDPSEAIKQFKKK
jgi:hypothetical protein